MAITQFYRRIRREQIDQIRTHIEPSPAAGEPDPPAWLLDDDGEPALVMLVEEPPEATDTAPLPDEADFSVDSYWQALHFLLTGEPEGGPLPLRNAVLGGTPLSDDHPARWLSPEEVVEVADSLSGIPRSDLEAVYDPQEFNQAQIYPARPPERWGWEDLGPLLDRFEDLVGFFRETAVRGEGLLLTRAELA